jgi:hypothetical protein
LAQPQLQKWARCSTTDFSFNVYVWREAVTGSSCSKDHGATPPPPRNASLPRVATAYNKLTGGGGGWCVSIPAYKPTWPQLYACFVFCLLSFLHLPLPSVRFLGQARAGCKTISTSFKSYQFNLFAQLLNRYLFFLCLFFGHHISNEYLAKMFSHSVGHLLILVNISFAVCKLFTLISSCLLILTLIL